MKTINTSIIAVFIISFIISSNCKTTSNQHLSLKQQNWFQEMWFQDTCEQKGHRSVLSDFILHKQEKQKFFKNKKDGIQLLGKPYQAISNDGSSSTFTYVVFINSSLKIQEKSKG